jgi:uncharacterized protein GlcG (DUF336 family)
MSKHRGFIREQAKVSAAVASAVLAIVLGFAGTVFAQGAQTQGNKISGSEGAGPAMTLAQATIPPAMAKRTMVPNIINVATAKKLADVCEQWVKENPRSVTMDIVVMSPSGQIVEARGLDGLMPIGQEATMEKAKTSLFTRQPTSRLEAQYEKDKNGLITRRDFAKDLGLAYFDVAGGFPIVVEGQLIGVIAVGGGAGGAQTPDSLCAYEALKKVIGPQPDLVLPGTH